MHLLLCCIRLHIHQLFFHFPGHDNVQRSSACTTRELFILRLIFNMGIISSVLGAIAKLLFGSEERPQEPPPQQPPRPYRPHRPQAERPPQSYPPSTSPPKQYEEHRPHVPRPPKHQHSVRLCLRLLPDCELIAYTNPDIHFIVLILRGMRYYRR